MLEDGATALATALRMTKSHPLPTLPNERQAKTPPAARRARHASPPESRTTRSKEALRARRKFLHAFPQGFYDETYVDWERGYKWLAHQKWQQTLSPLQLRRLIRERKFAEVAATAIRIESRTNLLFSFEKMALRDAVRDPAGAEAFALALFKFLHGTAPLEQRFGAWVDALGHLPRRKTRVLTWPLATVFGFIAEPRLHFFFKPRVTQEAARRYGVQLPYASRPSWLVYKALLDFAKRVRADLHDLRPRDMIDIQSFLWVQGSDEYPD